MAADLNSVKSPPGERYHHGALRGAMLYAAESLLAERGLEGFSLREAARRAGVSPAAPAHHFGDARGLLTSLATEAFRQFGDALEQADLAAARETDTRVRAQGIAYVEFALARPALFDLMWRRALLDLEEPEFRAVSRRAFALLEAAIENRAPVEANPPDRVDPRTIAAWSIVHGFARLALDGAFGLDREEARRGAREALPHVLDCLDVGPR